MFLDFYSSILTLLDIILGFIPRFIAAIVIFAAGWIIAMGIGKLVTTFLNQLKINQIFESGAWKEALEKAEWKIDPAGFIGQVVKWILVIVTLFVVAGILKLVEFANFLKGIIDWLPNVIVSAIIFVVAVVIADYLAKLVRVVVEGMKVGYAKLAETIVRWSIWIFAILAILVQLGIAKELVITLFTGVVAFMVIAGGIAFGLGGKDCAAEILRDLQKKIKE